MTPIDPAKSVFINCPYDDDFEPLFNAIFFAVVCCGLVPRSAIEAGSAGGVSRIERITRTLFGSKYSIHDLSRCRGEGDEQLARFNMPLELGMAMALYYKDVGKKNQHEWFPLVKAGHAYQRYISDLSGFDPATYDGTSLAILQKVMSWLINLPGANVITPPRAFAALPSFQAEVEQIKQDWGEKVWGHMLDAAKRHVPVI